MVIASKIFCLAPPSSIATTTAKGLTKYAKKRQSSYRFAWENRVLISGNMLEKIHFRNIILFLPRAILLKVCQKISQFMRSKIFFSVFLIALKQFGLFLHA